MPKIPTTRILTLAACALVAACASLNSADPNERIRALGRTGNPQVLAKAACDDPSEEVRLFAVGRIKDQPTLVDVVGRAKDWKVRKAGFNRLETPALNELSRTAVDPAMSLAARVKLGQESWSNAFRPGNLDNRGLGDVLGAAALVEGPQPAASSVVSACHTYIRRGDSSRIPELRDLLLRFGDKALAEDYLNCGNELLHAAASEWGNKNGYSIGTGNGSHRVRWGEGR